MYFVFEGDVLARYTGDEIYDPDDLPVIASTYDYDNESRWTDSKLKKEAARVDAESDNDACAAIEMEQRRRTGIVSVPEFADWENLVAFIENYMADAEDRRPLVLLEDVSLPVRKLIRDVAKVSREEITFRKKNRNKSPADYDDATKDELADLEERGWTIREKLMDSEFGDEILDEYDPVEQMKMMAAQMFFLYSESRLKAEIVGGKPDEDFFYAGSSLYAHAVADQLEEEEDDEDVDDDDGNDDEE